MLDSLLVRLGLSSIIYNFQLPMKSHRLPISYESLEQDKKMSRITIFPLGYLLTFIFSYILMFVAGNKRNIGRQINFPLSEDILEETNPVQYTTLIHKDLSISRKVSFGINIYKTLIYFVQLKCVFLSLNLTKMSARHDTGYVLSDENIFLLIHIVIVRHFPVTIHFERSLQLYY